MAGENDLGPYFQRLKREEAHWAQRGRVAEAPAHRPRRDVQPPAYGAALDPAMLEQTVSTHINLYRMAKGLRPLEAKPALAAAARRKSEAMAAGTAPFSHAGMHERLLPFMGLFGPRAGGEILAYNHGAVDPARAAMSSWLRSPTHKEVLESHYSQMGIGVARAGDGRYYMTVLFLR